MKSALIKFWLSKLAFWLADNNEYIIGHILTAIRSAELKFPKADDNSHRTRRINWVRDRASSFLTGKAPAIVNLVIELLLNWIRMGGGK